MSLPALYPFSPLALVLTDIERCIQAKIYYPALLISLTVPEICASLELDRSVFVKEPHYSAFVDKYAKPAGLGISGLDCYRLRGGVVHRANMAGHPLFMTSHVIFTIPETGGAMHGLQIKSHGKSALIFDLVLFCKAMIAGAYQWYEDQQNSPVVEASMKNLIRYCPDGLPPFVGGGPIVGSGE